MKIRIVCFRFDFNPLYCTAMFFVHQLHTYLPLIDLSFHGYIVVILQIESESIKKYQSALGDHSLILLSNSMEKYISFRY